MASVTGIVLAAGAAERMGQPKLLLPYRGSTVLDATIAAVETSVADRVIVVVGFKAEMIEASMEARRATIARNPDYRRGNMSSLLTATATDGEAEAFVLVPGDLPTIRTEAIDSMIDLWAEEKPWAAVTEYSDRVAHPFLLSRTAVESMKEMTGGKVLGRMLIESSDDRVVRLPVASEAPLDVNTPENYVELLRES